jgi:hypothetical protein
MDGIVILLQYLQNNVKMPTVERIIYLWRKLYEWIMWGGCIRNIDINEMINELQTTPNVERKDIFIDELVSISQVSLKANLFKSYNKNDIVIFVEGYCYNIE